MRPNVQKWFPVARRKVLRNMTNDKNSFDGRMIIGPRRPGLERNNVEIFMRHNKPNTRDFDEWKMKTTVWRFHDLPLISNPWLVSIKIHIHRFFSKHKNPWTKRLHSNPYEKLRKGCLRIYLDIFLTSPRLTWVGRIIFEEKHNTKIPIKLWWENNEKRPWYLVDLLPDHGVTRNYQLFGRFHSKSGAWSRAQQRNMGRNFFSTFRMVHITRHNTQPTRS